MPTSPKPASGSARPARRLVVCLDGTWNAIDGGEGATNVVKLMRAIAHRDGPVDQVVYYDSGVGTGTGSDKWLGGAFGHGLAANVRAAYVFLGNNWRDGDEIYLFGFSRGAFTARSLAGFIGAAGLLDRGSMRRISEAWAHYRIPPEERKARGLRMPGRKVPIACVGVWDTVGTLGVPFRLLKPFNRRRYGFHDTDLGPGVACGLHAVAIDERRRWFKPTLWTRSKDAPPTQALEQRWFPGCHSDVGGGHRAQDHPRGVLPDGKPPREDGLSDLALEWMVERVAKRTKLAFRADWRKAAEGERVEDDQDTCEGTALGVLHESRRGLYRLVPGHARPIPVQAGGRRGLHPAVWERYGSAAPRRVGKRLRLARYAPGNLTAAAAAEGPAAGRAPDTAGDGA